MKGKKVLIGILIAVVVLVLGFFILLMFSKDYRMKVNVNVKEDNIVLKVNSYKKAKLDKSFNGFLSGDNNFIGVNVTVKNNSKDTFDLNSLNCFLSVDGKEVRSDMNSMNSVLFKDVISDIPAGKKKTGYVYFQTKEDKNMKFVYESRFANKKKDKYITKNYTFRLSK